MAHIPEFHLVSGVSLSSNSRTRPEVSLREHPFIAIGERSVSESKSETLYIPYFLKQVAFYFIFKKFILTYRIRVPDTEQWP